MTMRILIACETSGIARQRRRAMARQIETTK